VKRIGFWIAFVLALGAVAQVNVVPLDDPGAQLRATTIFYRPAFDLPWSFVGYRLEADGGLRFYSEVWLDGKRSAGGTHDAPDGAISVVLGWLAADRPGCGLKLAHWEWSPSGGGSGQSCSGIVPEGGFWSAFLLPERLEAGRPYPAFWMRWMDARGEPHHLMQVVRVELDR